MEKDRKKIIVLAGGIDQIGLLEDLKARGYFTVLVDYYANPVAKPYADKHIQASTLDKDAVLDITRKEGASYIVTACTDQALTTMAYVSEKLGLPCQLSYEQALNVTNKLLMKKLMCDHGIPTAKFIDADNLSADLSGLEYPLMVKPADCNSSVGVCRVDNRAELEKAFDEAVRLSRTRRAIIEEFKEGAEISVDAFVKDGTVTILMCSAIKKFSFDTSRSVIFQSVIPAGMSDGAAANLRKAVDDIARVFKLDNMPILVQVIVNGDSVNVIEFSARLGGGLKYVTIREKTGFDVLHQNVNGLLGLPVTVDVRRNGSYLARTHIYTRNGVFDRIAGYEALIKDRTIVELKATKSSGTVMDGIKASGDRVGNFLVKADSESGLKEKIDRALNAILVLDKDGNDIFARELYF